MKIAYVCTNYNNTKYTREAISSLMSNGNYDIHIVVVDNKSNPESIDELVKIKNDFPEVIIIFNAENLGYFGGLNVGIRYLRDHIPSINLMIVGNNDLIFGSDFISSVELMSEIFETYPVVSPNVVTIDGIHQNPHVIKEIGKIRELFYDIYFFDYRIGLLIKWLARLFGSFASRGDENEWEIARPIYQGHGSCYLLGPLFFENFGELWAPTFLMGEEFFLSRQVTDVGLQIYYEPSIKVTHYWHATINSLPNRMIWKISRESHKIYRKYVKIFD